MDSSMLLAYESYNNNTKLLSKSLLRISTGFRINSASDDPSGLAIADKLKFQANSVKQGIENANSAIAMIQIADKAMGEQSNIIDIVKTKLIQASSSTTTDKGRESIRKDIVKLLEQLDNIAAQTNYNGNTLLQNSVSDDTSSGVKYFQIGEKAENVITLDSVRVNTKGLQLDAIKNLTKDSLSADVARGYLSNLDNALTSLNIQRAEFGSTQNQLESSIRYMMTLHTNLKNSESTIRDVDYAKEIAEFNRLSIITQAAMFAISQINKRREILLQYLFR